MNYFKFYRSYLVAVFILTFFSSCYKENIEKEGVRQKEFFLNQPSLVGMTKLGKQLENPYSVINMKIAWEELQKKEKISRNGNIEATHYYVKFKPKNDEELSFLKSDSTLFLYDVPLDYELEELGDFYHDPEVSYDKPTYQYTSVPITKKLPDNIDYEVLEELFIPDEDSDNSEILKNVFASKEVIGKLVDESLSLTGNLESDITKSALSGKGRWRPSGSIKVYDHILESYVGVSGVKVRARRWFTVHRGFTDQNGNYRCGGEI